jgi:hypothetical protein
MTTPLQLQGHRAHASNMPQVITEFPGKKY